MNISGARVLVTGATGGIGRAVVAAFRAGGAELVVSGRDEVTLRRLEGEGVRGFAADLRDDLEVRRLAREAGDVDVLVNNAGVGWYGGAADMPCADVRRLVDVNMLAPLLLTRLLLPGMLARRRGHVVFVSSVAGHLGVEHEAVYSATKAALVTYAEALRAELRNTGVAVSVVSPGAVDTQFFARRGANYQRSWPPAVPAAAVAAEVVRAVEKRESLVFVPHWLRVPAMLHDGLPGVYRGLANRFG
jgi:short-subunit dehydrogenase